MLMTDFQIGKMYRLAKDKEEQIKIMAQLNACSEKRIRKILGLPIPERQQAKRWSAKEDEIIIDMTNNGYSCQEIAKILGRSLNGLYNRRNYLISCGIINRRQPLVTESEIERVLTLYALGKTVSQIGLEMKRPYSTIYYILKKHL